MKTSHEFAKELLAGPDLPIFHFDPSRAGMDDENDTSLSEPLVEHVTFSPEEVAQIKDDADDLGREPLSEFLTIGGDGDIEDEPGTFAERMIEILLERGLATQEALEQARNTLLRTGV